MNEPSIQTIIKQARQCAEAGKLEDVEKTLNEALLRYSDSIEIAAHLGYFYSQQKRWRRAETLIGSVVESGHADEGAHALLKEIQQQLKPLNEQHESNHAWQQTYYKIVFPILIAALKLVEAFTKTKRQSRFSLSHFVSTLRNAPPKTQQACLAYHKAREILIASQAMPFQQQTARILDLGAGNNSLPIYWSRHGCEVVALDGSMYGFPALREIQQNGGGAAHFVCGDVTQFPFHDASFDGISALCMIEHLPYNSDVSAMREIFRILKPGGVAAVTVEANRDHFEEWIELPYEIGFQIGNENQDFEELFCRNYSPATMDERLLRSAQWNVISSGFYDDGILPVRNYFNRLERSLLRSLLRPFQPLLSLMFYRLTQKPDTLSPSSIGFAVLQKPL